MCRIAIGRETVLPGPQVPVFAPGSFAKQALMGPCLSAANRVEYPVPTGLDDTHFECEFLRSLWLRAGIPRGPLLPHVRRCIRPTWFQSVPQLVPGSQPRPRMDLGRDRVWNRGTHVPRVAAS